MPPKDEMSFAKRRAMMMKMAQAAPVVHVWRTDEVSGQWVCDNVEVPSDPQEQAALCEALMTHAGVQPGSHELSGGRVFLRAPPRPLSAPMRRVVVGYDELMTLHASPSDRYPERPQRIIHAMETLASDDFISQGLAARATPRASTVAPADILAIHRDDAYRAFFAEANDSAFAASGLGNDMHIDSEGHTRRAAQAAVAIVVDCALKPLIDAEAPRHAFCLVRPPGHHCSCKPNGFCVVNNVMVAARSVTDSVAVQQSLGRKPRIAIVDVDVHHGDGTQALVDEWNAAAAADATHGPPLLFISSHRYDNGTFFPGTGAPQRTGCVPGTTLNVAFNTARKKEPHKLICDDTFDAFANELVVPALGAYQPDLIFVSCGFDVAEGDPLGGMGVVHGFERFASAVCRVAPAHVPIVYALEGGYDVEAVAQGTRRIVTTMMSEGFVAPPPAPPLSWLQHAAATVNDSSESKEDALQRLRALHAEWAHTTIATTVQAVGEAQTKQQDGSPTTVAETQRLVNALTDKWTL